MFKFHRRRFGIRADEHSIFIRFGMPAVLVGKYYTRAARQERKRRNELHRRKMEE